MTKHQVKHRSDEKFPKDIKTKNKKKIYFRKPYVGVPCVNRTIRRR